MPCKHVLCQQAWLSRAFTRQIQLPFHIIRLQCPSLLSLIVVLALATSSVAQNDPGPGVVPFSSNLFGLDLATTNVNIAIPMRSKVGKIPYSSYLVGTSRAYTTLEGSNVFWRIGMVAGLTLSEPTTQSVAASVTTAGTCTGGGSYYKFVATAVVDNTGAGHKISLTWYQGNCNQTQSAGPATSIDGEYTFVIANAIPTLYDKSGNHAVLSCQTYGSCFGTTLIDPDGNMISWSAVRGSNGTATDTLSTTALGVIYGTTSPNPLSSLYYTDNNNNQQSYNLTYASTNVLTNFGCSSIGEWSGSPSLLTSITTPAGSYSFTYETTPGHSGYYTGRIATITYPNGGTISYAYSDSTGNNGMNCTSHVVPTVTITVNDSNGDVMLYKFVNNNTTAPVQGNPHGNYTVVETDPANNQGQSSSAANQTVHYFAGEYETQTLSYQGPVTGTPLKAIVTCYNANFTSCATPSSLPGLPITQTDVYTSLNGSPYSVIETKYDSHGNVSYQAIYDYDQTVGSAPTGTPLQATTTTYATLGNYIYDKPSSVTVVRAGSQGSQTSYTNYTSTGHAKNVSKWVGASSSLGSSYTYNANGTVATMSDVNGALYTYAYNGTGGCNGVLPTSVTVTGGGLLTAGLTNSTQWVCNGGVVIQTTDPNSQPTVNTYNDPLWRLTSTQDPTGATTTICYGIVSNGSCTPNPNYIETVLPINSTLSAGDKLTAFDGLGRTIFIQKRQTPTSGTFDSVQYTYGWNTTGAVTTVSMPYSGTQGQAAPTGTSTTTQHDALGRVQSVTNPGTGAGVVTSVFNQNDVLQTLSPAPSGESTKQKQLQYDGLGRLTSVCEVTAGTSAWPGGNCAQTSAQTGYWTKYVYDSPANSLTVTQNAQGSATQTRSYTYDGLGRLLSEQNPESGTKTYLYDSDQSGACTWPDNSYYGSIFTGSYPGNLVKKTDASGNVSCYQYDAAHRLSGVIHPYGPAACARGAGVPCPSPDDYFVYDAATVNGAQMTNAKGRTAEAYTCAGACGSKLTDLGFGYDAVGRSTDFYELTPHSSGYYHVTGSYWANGLQKTLNGVSLPTITYGVDGEGRANTVSASAGVNPVSSTSYNAAGQATDVVFGSSDPVHFGFDSNTGRMTQYKLTINGTATYGNLTWNPNGTLQQLAITDPFNAQDAGPCNYGHDDLARVASVDCGATIWQQNFTYDAFGNITKTVPSGGTGTSFQPGYNPASNQYTDGATYDADGNLTNDGTDHVYTWDADGNPVTLDSDSLVYDALGREVEVFKGGAYTEFVFGPTGKLALMNGQTQTKAFVRLPGGTQVKYAGNTISTYRLPDWLGSFRVGSNANRTYSWGVAFAPFGEMYAQSGVPAWSFTGEQGTADTVSDEYDFLARKLHSAQGRWISPDPAGFSAANAANPQSWNRYAYAANTPLSLTDPLGLCVGVCRTPVFPGSEGAEDCQIDGAAEPCWIGYSILGVAGVQCPGNECSPIAIDGVLAHFVAYETGSTYDPYGGPGVNFDTNDQAMIAGAMYAENQSLLNDGNEQCGVTYASNDKYSYSDSVEGTATECDFRSAITSDFEQTAGAYHSHGVPVPGYNSEAFSVPDANGPHDVGVSNFWSLPLSLATPGGNVMVYYPNAGCQTFFLGSPYGTGTTTPICP